MTNPYKTSGLTKEYMNHPKMRKPIGVRLLSKSKWNGTCLEYQGRLDPYGYGIFKVLNRALGAHRVAYAQWVSDIPAGVVIMHKCDNPRCINPAHLSTGTVKDNVHDCIEKGRFKNTNTICYRQ